MTKFNLQKSSPRAKNRSDLSRFFGSHQYKKKAEGAKPRQQSVLRLLLVWGVLVLATLALAGKLYYLQIIDPVIVYKQAPQGKRLKEIAADQQYTKIRFYKPRRQIVDRQQNVLATDRISYELYAHPYLFKRNAQTVSPQEVAEQLAEILETETPEKFLQMFSQRDRGIRIASNLPESVKQKITRLRIDGLDLVQNYGRFYPYQEMVAEVTGYVNRDKKPLPQAGIEFTQQKLLERPELSWSLKRSFIKDKAIFYPGEFNQSNRLLKFDDLRLQSTIDLRLQQAARQALQAQMEHYQAKRGAVIVMDVRDGSIAALVNEPTYDPNRYFEYKNFELFKNWAITDLYEPGSTFKPINVAIALDAGVINPSDRFNDTGKIEVGGWPIRNHDFATEGARGILNIAQILQHSSNVGMIKIIERLDRKDYYHRLQQLGIQEKLEFEIPGYTVGQLKDEVEFVVKPIEAATASFGQGFSLTALKLIQLHGAIANGGKLVTPHVVRGLVDFQGNLHWQPSLLTKKVFSPETSRSVLEMMETVVEKGSGQTSKIPGYRIAGKTGTAQKANNLGGYDENAKITSFVGIFPVESPRYAVLAVVDEPQGQYTFGSTVAAPIVKSVIEGIIAIEGIPPATKNSDQ
jgi:cell division protein FtsI (penicillin-binding protein 3)